MKTNDMIEVTHEQLGAIAGGEDYIRWPSPGCDPSPWGPVSDAFPFPFPCDPWLPGPWL